jgi:transposase
VRDYKKSSSNYLSWEQKGHAEKYLLYPKNMGAYLAIDEVALSKGELYTLLTNKAKRSKKGTIIAIIHGTKSQDICSVLEKLPNKHEVKEVTMDMAPAMELAIKSIFPQASQVSDRFHVVQLLTQALQKERIEHRWMAIKQENERIKKARRDALPYFPEILPNGDTLKQLLARSRYLLFKTPDRWTSSQAERAKILFKRYPDLHKAYKHHLEFRAIYQLQDKTLATRALVAWIETTITEEHYPFYRIILTLKQHFDTILNFFDRRSTNAYAESFNAKIKLFRANLRGVKNNLFFLFRLEKLFA